jgi:hypothetical protein
MKRLNKTDKVVQLLRHLPYIKPNDGNNYGECVHAAPWTSFVDWDYQVEEISKQIFERPDSKINISCFQGCLDSIPSHIVGLTAGCGPDELIFLLDTKLGVVYFHSCPDEISFSPPPCRECIEEDPWNYGSTEEEWRLESAVAWPIADFFEVLKDQFRKLRYVPESRWRVVDRKVDTLRENEDPNLLLPSIYRAHGWPDLDLYRKDECLQAVADMLK